MGAHHQQQQLVRADTAAAAASKGAAPALFDQLDKALKGPEGKELVAKTKVGAAASAMRRQHAWRSAGDAAAAVTCCAMRVSVLRACVVTSLYPSQ